jgi:DNA polymerase type B, organellar and viral.
MSGAKRKQYVADFETTTNPDDCRVWGWGICDIDRAETIWDVHIGTSMDRFIGRVTEENSIIYFHNLKFDGVFIVDRLFNDGFEWVPDNPRRGEFTTLISSQGAWYSLTVTWRNGKKTEFRDSNKKLPFAASVVAEAFNLPESKLSIDYHADRPVGYQHTMAERTYIAHDVLIIAKAMKVQLDQGMTKLTVGADALHEYKNVLGGKVFKKMFPILSETMDAEIRRAYRGGFTYVDTRHQGNITAGGRVYDVNSLYPSVMYDRVLPYGEPLWCAGLPAATEEYPLFIVSVTFTAKLKKDHIPCIQVKGFSRFVNTEYQTHITEPVTLMCTSVDLALWEDHYDMDILSYNGGWLFTGVQGIFKTYIDKWMEVKMNSEGGMRALSKLMLTSLYGKFATNPDVTGKVPVFRDNTVQFEAGMEETRDPVYTAMGVFITAYARDLTIRAAQTHYDTFAYADTDSLHLLIDDDPDTLDVDPKKLGAWKREYIFEQALFVRAKTYTEVVDGQHITHIAGLPVAVQKTMTFEHFKSGTYLPGKLTPKRVPGGVVLIDSGFTMP